MTAYGYDEVARHIYYGLRAHLRLVWPGVLVDCALAPPHLSDTEGAEKVLHGVPGYVLAPYKSAKHQKQPYPRYLTHIRYRIETVSGQLVQRFHAKSVWARDLWHLTSRWMSKFLSHTLAVFFCAQPNLSYLSFAKLVTH